MRISDWSSDVCSSDLAGGARQQHGDGDRDADHHHHDHHTHERKADSEITHGRVPSPSYGRCRSRQAATRPATVRRAKDGTTTMKPIQVGSGSTMVSSAAWRSSMAPMQSRQAGTEADRKSTRLNPSP